MSNLKHLTDNILIEYYKLYKDSLARSKRVENVKINEGDTKYMYHLVRLLLECKMILLEGDLDLTRNREQLKSIRRGEWKLEDVTDYFTRKEAELETLYTTSKLQHSPDEAKIKQLLLNCLETHYGDLSSVIITEDKHIKALNEIKIILERTQV